MELVLIVIYGLFLSFIFLYSLVQLSLALAYVRSHRKNDDCVQKVYAEGEWPSVTIQLPVFNELYVVERLIESVAKLDYPRDKFEIQVLDDSDDESFEVAAKKVKEIAARGINISHVKRPERVGFKAGA